MDGIYKYNPDTSYKPNGGRYLQLLGAKDLYIQNITVAEHDGHSDSFQVKFLKVITDWAYQWKMQFNPDINKQAVQVIFSQKRTKLIHPPLFFNDAPVVIKDEQKHLGMVLDSALNFRSHVKEKIISARKGIGVIRYLSKYVSRDVLDQIYKLYVRPHLDYGDIIYHKFDPELTLEFTKKLETVQYSVALAVSGAWRGTNKCKLYKELGWEYLYHRRWYRRLIHFYKLKQSRLPSYLYNLIPP